MFDELRKKLGIGKGWHENKDPLCLNKKGEPVAPRHHDVSVRKEFEKCFGNTNNTVIVPKTYPQNSVKLTLTVPSEQQKAFTDTTENYSLQNGVKIRIERDNDNFYINIPGEYVKDYFDHLEKNSLEIDEDFKNKIIEEVQSERSDEAVVADNRVTAENVGDKEDDEDLVKWVKDPAGSDLQGIDTKRPVFIQADKVILKRGD